MKNSHIIGLAFWLAVLGILLAREVFFLPWANSLEFRLLSTIGLAAIMFGWFLADSRERNLDTPFLLKILVVALGVIAIPYYRFRYSGIKSGFVFLAIIAAGVLVVSLLATLIDYFVYREFVA